MNNDDREQLRLLSMLHYVAASLSGFLLLMGTAYGVLGVAILMGKLPTSVTRGWGVLAFGAAIASMGVLTMTLNIITARSLPETRHRVLCLATGCLNLLHVPLGTALGAFTLALLSRPSIREAFSQGAAPTSTALTAQGDWGSRTSAG